MTSADVTDARRAEQESKYLAMPELGDDAGLSREDFDALLGSHPGALSWSIRIDAASTVMPELGRPGPIYKPASVLFVRAMKPSPTVSDYVRVWVYDVAGTLRTTAQTDDERAFLREMVALARPALERMLAERAAQIAEAIASAPALDHDALTQAIRAMTFGAADVATVRDAVVLATTDPLRYVAIHAAACAERGITRPIKGLHVVALLDALPKDALLTFDWKESMEEVLPMLARLLAAGPKLSFDLTPWRAKSAEWDRRSRTKALKEIAAAIPEVALVEVKTDSDSYAFVAIPANERKRVAAWKKKAHLPLAPL